MVFCMLLLAVRMFASLAGSKSVTSCKALSWCVDAAVHSVQYHCAISVHNCQHNTGWFFTAEV